MAPATVIETLKQILRTKKISYQHLADELGLSESGVKKLFNASDLSMKRLNQIADAIAVPVLEILQLAEEQKIKHVTFTARQEEAFLADEMLFRVFWHLTVEEKSVAEILGLEKLSVERMDKYLIKLETRGLIRKSKSGKIYKTHNGLIRWSNDGKLLKKLNAEWSKSTLEKALAHVSDPEYFHRLSYFRLSAEAKEDFYNELNSVILKYARRSNREKIQKSARDLEPIGLLIAVAPNEFLS